MFYTDEVFHVRSLQDAKAIILTPHNGVSTEERWRVETPQVIQMIIDHAPNAATVGTILDYGCGIGRLSKAMIDRTGCLAIGVDISWSMRALAVDYVRDDRFFTCSPYALRSMGITMCDLALAVWTLQHCRDHLEALDDITQRVRIGGYIFVINSGQRWIPTEPVPSWLDDGINIRALMNSQFEVIKEGSLTGVLAQTAADDSFWGVYQV